MNLKAFLYIAILIICFAANGQTNTITLNKSAIGISKETPKDNQKKAIIHSTKFSEIESKIQKEHVKVISIEPVNKPETKAIVKKRVQATLTALPVLDKSKTFQKTKNKKMANNSEETLNNQKIRVEVLSVKAIKN